MKASIKASEYHLNPLLLSSFKKPAKANPLLAEYIKPTKYELMRWSNYPLTAAQIEARNKEWDRQNNRSLGEQIAGDILETYLKAVLSGKKQVVAVRPRF